MRIGSILGSFAMLSLAVQPVAAAEQAPAPLPDIDPVTGLYKPADKDERGLWMQVDEEERHIKTSPLLITDPGLNDYVRHVFCRTVGANKCRPIRIYLIRTPDFNAQMYPNGMMEVWSGLLLRTRNEAQLAAVLGHEYTHYEQRHTLKLFRDIRSKTSTAVWLSMIVGVLGSLMVLPSIFQHSREMEHEADVGGLNLMAKAGYDTREASRIWEQLRAEMDATAVARNTKSRKDKDQGMWATHPPSAERVKYLVDAAVATPGTPGATGSQDYARAMTGYWPMFVDDQLKRNDFGASEFLMDALIKDGASDWVSYAHGELYRRRAAAGDLEKAVGFYSDGIKEGAFAALWRGRGLARLKLGQADAGKADLVEYLKRSPDAPDRAMIAMMAGG